MKLFDTLTSKKEEFIPRETDKVSMYVCGPTVYNYIHIGNARAYIAFDAIYRYLQYKGYKVTYARNLTDVDDKIINRAKKEKTTPEKIAEKYTKAFHKDMEILGVKPPTVEPKATEHIKDMIKVIHGLIDNKLAYIIEGDVYFSVTSFKNYGKLSKRNLDDMIAGSRVEVDKRKKHPMDFALWKNAKEGEPAWDSPWGKGRPGWHIECSTMSMKYLKFGFDIHGGGQDLIFPHHENEIAQAEGYTLKSPFVRYWLHNGFLNIKAEKMAKSVGNVILIKDLENKYENRLSDLRNDLRMLFLSTHYRSPLNFTDKTLEEAKAAVNRIKNALERLQEFNTEKVDLTNYSNKSIEEFIKDFEKAMDNDFNTPNTLAHVYNFIKNINTVLDKKIVDRKFLKAAYLILIKLLTEIFGFVFKKSHTREISAKAQINSRTVQELLDKREKARQEKDFKKADLIRDKLKKIGLEIKDTPQGQQITKTI